MKNETIEQVLAELQRKKESGLLPVKEYYQLLREIDHAEINLESSLRTKRQK